MFQEIRPFGTELQEITGPDTISIVTQPTALDDFYHETIVVSEKESVTFITTDISLLFNQQRLMQASPLALDRLINNLESARPDSLKGFTDEQLASAVKSRYIQSAADMQEYMRSVMMNTDEEIQAIQAKAAEIQAQQEASSQDSSESVG
jgi:hypothetical protein